MTRVVDWTDLTALAILPFACAVPPLRPASNLKHASIAAMSFAAFVATSPARSYIPVPQSHELRNFYTARTVSDLEKKSACGLLVQKYPNGRLRAAMYWHRRRLVGSDIDVQVTGTADEVNGKVVLHFEEIHVIWEHDADEQRYLEELQSRLKNCLDY